MRWRKGAGRNFSAGAVTLVMRLKEKLSIKRDMSYQAGKVW